MKKMYIISFVITILLLSITIVGANELSNGDFEGGNIGGWSTWCVTGETSTLENHTPGGRFSAAPTLNDANGPFIVGGLAQDINGVVAGDQLSGSVWIKTENLAGKHGVEVQAILKLEFWRGGEIIKAEEAGRLSGTNDWKKVKINITAPEGTDLAKFVLLLWNADGAGRGSTGKVFFDDAELIITR